MIVHIPSPLRSYTCARSKVDAEGATVEELLQDLDRAYPGIRFRMVDEQGRTRQHIKIFVDGRLVNQLREPLSGSPVVHIICALSGG